MPLTVFLRHFFAQCKVLVGFREDATASPLSLDTLADEFFAS
jgi:hypothetical protein